MTSTSSSFKSGSKLGKGEGGGGEGGEERWRVKLEHMCRYPAKL